MAVKAEWKCADDLLRFWSTDYNDDDTTKQLLMKKLKPPSMLVLAEVSDDLKFFFECEPSSLMGKFKKDIADNLGKPLDKLSFTFEKTCSSRTTTLP